MNTRSMGFAALAVALALAGCAQVKQKPTLPAIQEELQRAAAAPKPAPLPAAVEAALAPQSKLELPSAMTSPKAAAQPVEPRFDLAVNNAPAQQVFMGIASGTRYSMLLHPEVAGNITVNLKDVSVPEALEAIRELYGYDFHSDGSRVFVQPLTAQTRFYSINYPSAVRQGKSELRVISGSITDSSGKKAAGGSNTSGSSGGTSQVDSSRIVTTVSTDFWSELQLTIGLLIGCSTSSGAAPATPAATPATTAESSPPATHTVVCPEGRNVVVSPHTGMLAVRALPSEQRQVGDYLKAAKISVERQVMIEAKILEVTLNEGAQSGINWAAIGNSHGSPFALSSNLGHATFPSARNPFINSTADFGVLNQAASNTLFGLAFQTDSFAALINFLETQGGVQVLSSPRIAAINNQKAVLKVGTDEFFVTEITTTSSTTGTTTSSSPSVTVQPFFSGIALDVTPQIDDLDNIILHVHPSVSVVTTNNKNISLGTLGTYTLPLATSTISETDSIVRLRNGEIAAIGGLMKRESRDDDSGVPGLSKIPGLGVFFKNNNASRLKQELVILLKPTLIKQQSDWLDTARDAGARMREFPAGPAPR